MITMLDFQIDFSRLFPQFFLAMIYFYAYSIFIVLKAMKQRNILSQTPLFPEARIKGRMISEKLGAKKRIIICESYFRKEEDNYFGVYGSVKKCYVIVNKENYYNLLQDKIVLLAEVKSYLSMTAEEGIKYYSIAISENEYNAHTKFWNKEKLIELYK